MNTNDSVKVQLDHLPIKTLEVIEVEASAEDDADDDTGVAPENVLRQPRAPQR
jgi:hypothetical protein